MVSKRPRRIRPNRYPKHSSYAKRKRFFGFEALEDRKLLDGAAAHVFAQFADTLGSPSDTKQFDVSLTSAKFTLSGGSTNLGFQARANNSPLDPASVQIVNTTTGVAVTPLYSYPDLANRTQSLVLATLSTGNYRLTVGSERGNVGAFQLDVFLVGDVDGDRMVTTADGLSIQNRLGSVAGQANYKVEADANLDGRIDTFDYSRWRTNLNDKTSVNPLTLGVNGLFPDPINLSNGSLLTNTTQHNVIGTVTAGADLALETGSDNLFDEGSVVGSSTNFGINLLNKLSEGANTVKVRARESFGQERVGSLRVILDTQSPAVVAALGHDTAPGGLTNNDGLTFDPVIVGQVTDANQITSLKAALDSTLSSSFVDITGSLTASGSFSLSRAQLEAIGGATLSQGSHILHLKAADQAGNTSSFFDLSFNLDTEVIAVSFDLSAGSDTGVVGDRKTTAAKVTLVGQTDPGATITLQPGGATALASGQGTFQFVDVSVAIGSNAFTATAVDPAGNSKTFSTSIVREVAVAGQDVVLQWNQIALEAVRVDATTPPQATRFLAMAQLAVFDTVSGLEGTPGYYVSLARPTIVSMDAAVSAAAERVLEYAYPGQVAKFQLELNTILAGIPDGAAETNAVNYGRQVADAIIAIRNADGWDDYVSYVPDNTPGKWQPTGPMFDVALLPQWGNLTPFAMTSPDQFMQPGPPSLNSENYAVAFNEVKQLGNATGSNRSPEQTQIARFWADGSGTYTPPGHWNQIAGQVLEQRGNSLSANARILAQLNVGLADAAILAWNAKYDYNFWRPVTAIERAADDNNPATEADAGWSSLLITPPFPEYVSGHSTFSGAAAEILTALVGDNVAFSTSSYGLPGVQRTFSSFKAAANEAGRSRVYGGIHFEFSNQDGLSAGKQIADHVLQRFSVTSDTQPPTVIIQSPQANLAYDYNITVTGLVTDTLSGVASLRYQLDGGELTTLSFDAQGHFELPLMLALGGTADGMHTLQIIALDMAGNIGDPVFFEFVLDTVAPTITLSGPVDGATIGAGAQLQGTANPTGSALIALTYAFDGGSAKTVSFNPSTGAFNQALDLSQVSAGAHTLNVIATDSAGNSNTATVSVTVELVPLNLSAVSPANGSIDVGSTFRPRVDFSKSVNPASLTANNFYASFGGRKLPATIVPSSNGRFAWLFFDDPMPNASLIRVTVDGSSILAADETGAMDADGDGTPGGVRTFDFTTVSLTPVAGTSLSGKILDPGEDLKPMTFDDIRAGADGILHTADDVYLHPLAHVKVYILGLENQAVYTDSNGNFSFASVPGGNIKLGLDGRTATNVPDGIYFPEMVMDLNIEVGQANAVMGTMGTAEERSANKTRPEVYLPRIRSEILQTVSNTAVTNVQTTAAASPNLSAEQRSYLQIEIQPGSAIGENGLPLTSAQVGISTVPPELVRDMLPPGVLQHTFDITVQAPGTATFAAPAQMTFPNVFNAAPGTKLDFLSFDHTTGKLVIEGTATVSADGKSVTTDPGSGATHPGWHGLTPPGGCGGSGGPPPPPPPPPTPKDTVNDHAPEAKPMIFGQTGSSFSKTWTAPPKLPGAPPKTPPPAGCGVPPPPPPRQQQQPYLNVSIQVDGPLAEFMKKDPSATNALPLSNYSFTLQAGTPGTVSLAAVVKNYEELFGAGKFKDLTRDQLYGSQIKITEIRGNSDGSKTYDKYTYYIYRWIDVIDAVKAKDKTGDTAAFMRTLADGSGGMVREKKVDVHLPTSVQTKFDGPLLGSPFKLPNTSGITTATWKFDPFLSGDRSSTFDVEVNDPNNSSLEVGHLNTIGKAINATEINVNTSGYKAELKRALYALKANAAGTIYYTYTDGGTRNLPACSAGASCFATEFAGFLPANRQAGPDGVAGNADDTFTGGNLDTFLNGKAAALKAAVQADYATANTLATGYKFVDSGGDVTVVWEDSYQDASNNITTAGGSPIYGYADFDRNLNKDLLCTPGRAGCTSELSEAARQYALANGLNQNVSNRGSFAIGINVSWSSAATFAQFVANTVSHEVGHTFGLNDAYTFTSDGGRNDAGCGVGAATGTNCKPNDIMRSGADADGDLTFDNANLQLLQAALGIQPNGDLPITAGLTLTRDTFNLPSTSRNGIRESLEGDDLPELGVFRDDIQLFNQASDSAGTVAADGAGSELLAVSYYLRNVGLAPLTINKVSLANGSSFTIYAAGIEGIVLDIDESVALPVQFDPLTVGLQSDTLTITSDATATPSFQLSLQGTGISPTPFARVTVIKNNLGGVSVTSGVSNVTEVATITNDGAQPLTLSAIQLAEGLGRFTLVGMDTAPAELATGESFAFGVSFDPDHVGLDRALIDIITNDPVKAIQRISAVGTGLDSVVYPQWGNDYQAIDTPDLAGSDTLRVVSDDDGNFSLFLPPSTAYDYSSFDPDTGLIARSIGQTAVSGGFVDLTSSLVFGASSSIDTDFDGLSDDIEHAIGTNPEKRDTNKDGIDDFTAIQTGIDPLGLEGLPLGIIGTVKPAGSIDVRDVVASSETAYLAAGAGGIQVVDITKITKPSVIASVPSTTLGGDAVAVSFTSIPGDTPGTFLNLVAAALGNNGLAIVDVTDPPASHLLTRVPVPGSALSVQIVDNLAYVGGSGGLVSILDMKSQELITTFSVAGSGDVTAVKFNAGTLYTLRGGTLAAYDISSNLHSPSALSTLTFPGATRLFVGTDRAYVTGNLVFEAVNITDPSNLQNTSGERPSLNYGGLSVNGSGRLIVSVTAAFDGNFKVGLFNISDPDNTDGFLTEFDTPGTAPSVFIQNGLALIADGAGGLSLFNYLPFDQGTTPPTISVTTTSPDGVHAVEGSRLRVDVSTLDDVQTREVTLSANGVALEPDGSYPFSFFVDVPTLASGATHLSLLVTATDTGGNQSSRVLDLTIAADTIAPQLLSFVPSDNRIQFNSVASFRATFDEPLENSTLNATSVHVINAGPDGSFGTVDDVPVGLSALDFDFRLSINMLTVVPIAPFAPGKYELQLNRALITDRAGNPLGTGLFKSHVTVQAIPFNSIISGEIVNPGQLDLFSFSASAGGEVTLFADWDADWNAGGSGLNKGQISLLAPDGSTVLGSAESTNSLLLADIALPVTGIYTVRVRAANDRPLAIGTYQFTISDPDTTPKTISFGQTKTGTIAVRGDDQEWQFTASAGDQIVFSYGGLALEEGIRFVNPDGSTESLLPAGSSLVRFASAVTQTGIYKFVLDTDQGSGNYSIELNRGSFTDALVGAFNVVQSNSINPLYNIDQYRYHLAAGDVITVYANMGGIGEGQLRLLDAATGSELVPAKSGSWAKFTRFTNTLARDVLVEVRGKPGIYFDTGSYTVTVSDPETTYETLAFGGQQTRAIAVFGDDQEWQFTATGGEVISLGYRGAYLSSGFTVKRPDNSVLAVFPAGYQNVRVQRDLLLDQAGTYQFVLADDSSTGTYTLNLSNPADEESLGTALTTNVARTDAIGTVFDIDVFQYTAIAGVGFSLLGEWLPQGSGLGYGEIQLLDPTGTSVGSVTGYGASSIAVSSPISGNYKVRVRAASGNDFSTGAYRLTAFAGADSPTNDTLGSAVATGISGAGPSHFVANAFVGDNIHGIRDVDMYRVDAARGDQIIAAINAAGAGSDLDSYLRLFDAAGNQLATNDNFGSSRDSTLQYSVLTPGIYYVGVSSNANYYYNPNTAGSGGGGGTVGAYSVTLDVVQDHTGPRVTTVSPTGISTSETITQFTVDFNEALNASTAIDVGNYQLIASVDGVFDNGNDTTIPVTVSYDNALRVTLNVASALPRGDTYRLTMRGVGGVGELPLTDIAGNALNDGLDDSRILDLVASVGVPTTTFPLSDGFESAAFDTYWSISTTGSSRANIIAGETPHAGARHVKMDNPGAAAGRSSMTLLVDYSALAAGADVDLSFFSRDGEDGNESMPSSFSGRVNADGVAISNDGVKWVRIDDLGARNDYNYSDVGARHVIDLNGAVTAAGLTFAQPLHILFQHFLYPGYTAYFDDVQLNSDLSGPTITSISTPGPFVFSSNLSSITLDFSEPLQLASAISSSSYQLYRRDTGSTIGLTALYDSANRSVTLNTGTLTPASYQLTVRGNSAVGGTTQVRDVNGNLLNNGADSVYNFELFALESPNNDETDTATATGLTHSGGSYTLTTAIGNNAFAGRDVDLYKFTASPGDRVSANISSQFYFSNPINSLLKLFDADGNVLATNDNSGGSTDSQIDQYVIFTAGSYFLGVSTSANSTYNPLIAPSGTTGPIGKYRINVSLTPDTTPPTVVTVAPHAGPNSNSSLTTVLMTFSEPVTTSEAGNAANYTLTNLGADGVVGGSDDTSYTFTSAYSSNSLRTTLTLTGPESILPLPIGSYRLTAKGTTGGITDLAGNRLGGGVDFVQNFSIIGPEDPLNDRMADAYNTNIAEDGGLYKTDAAIGDNAFAAKDVDLYALQLRAGLRLTVDLKDKSIGSPLSSRLRLFNSAGTLLAAAENSSTDELMVYDIAAPDMYYIGVSGSGNDDYNPASPGSGFQATTTGEYVLSIRTEDVIVPTITTISPSGIVLNSSTSQISAQFSEPMNVTAAESSSSYMITLSGADRRFGTADDVTLPTTAYSATYDIGASRVRLDLANPLPNGDVRLTSLASPLVDRAGLHLNGGVNDVRTFSVVTAGASLPFFDPLDVAPFGSSWLTSQTDPSGLLDVTIVGGPRRGAAHMRLSSTATNQWTTATNILAVNAAGATALELSFYEKRGDNENSYGLPASFTGNVLGDGVAIGVDGQHWYRIVDLSTQSGTAYDHYVVNLVSAAASHGLSLSSTLLVRFSNSEYYGGFDSQRYARYFDDIRVAPGATAPVVSSLSQGTFLTAPTPDRFGVVFSKSVTTASATTTANYQLVRAGADRLLGTADDNTVSIDHVTYDDGLRTATIFAATTMPTDAYRITILPTVQDGDGLPLNEGLAQTFTFDATASEASEDQTRATATSTGLISTADGTYSITTAIGNDSHGTSDVDHYSLTGGAGQRLAVYLSHFGVNMAPLKIRILDSTGAEIAATGTVSNANPQLLITLPSTQTYYVAISPNNVGGGRSLYSLRLTTNVGVAIPPLTEGFESPDLPPYFTTYSSDSSGVIGPSTNHAHTGSRSLSLANNGTYSLQEANMTVDGTALGHIDFSFNAYVGYYEYYYYLNSLNPASGHFTGHYNGDGVAFSVDGNTWYPVVDYVAAKSNGSLQSRTWTKFTVDLSAAAIAAGVTLTDHTQIRFQNYGPADISSPYYYGIYIDDIRLDSDLVGPKVTSATGLDSFVVATDLTSLQVTFNESLDADTASLADNYQLRSAGLDELLDTADDVLFTVVPTYDDSTHSTSLAITDSGAGLATGIYRLRMLGTGGSPLKDLTANPLYDGVNMDIVFSVFPPEAPTNNTLAAATETGLTPAGGGYTVRAMLGNDGSGQQASFTDIDQYRVDAAPGQRLYVTGLSRYGNPNLRIRIFDSSGTPITSIDDETSNGLQVDGFELVDGGTYYIGVSDSANNNYTGSGSGSLPGTRGWYDLAISLISPAPFPFTDGFETGSLNGAYWDRYSVGGGIVTVNNRSPLDGGYSAVLSTTPRSSSPIYPQEYYQQSELTLHLDLSGVTNAELRFDERNNYDYYSYNNPPDFYSGRNYGADGLYLSVDGATFYRIPNVFDKSVGAGSGFHRRVIDLDEIAALRGITLGSNVQLRFQANIYADYDYARSGRQLDDVQVIADTVGPQVTDLSHNASGNSFAPRSTSLLNDIATVLTATFDDRLDASLAANAAAYEWRFAGSDGLFDNGDDQVFALAPSYDGNFIVNLAANPAIVPYPAGAYRLTIRGTGSTLLTDAEGNLLNDGADTTRFYSMIDPGPAVIVASPSENALIAPSIGFSSLNLTFNEAVLASSFSSEDVRITDQDGFVMVPANDIVVANSGNGIDWTVSWPAIHSPGYYHVTVGPNINDLAGNLMNQNHDLTNGSAYGDAYQTYVRVSDTSSTYTLDLTDQDGFVYDINLERGSVEFGGRTGTHSTSLGNHSYSRFGYLQVDGSYYTNSGSLFALVGDDQRTVVLPTRSLNGLRVHREEYVPADGNFIRYLDVLQNLGTEPITREIRFYGYTLSATIIADSSSDGRFDTNDTYLATDDGTDDFSSRLAQAHVSMDGSALTMSSASLSSGSLSRTFTVTVGPGQTVRLMTLESQQLTRANAIAQAQSLLTLPAATLAHLSDQEKGSILNFNTGFDTIAPYISSTNLNLPNDQYGDISQIEMTFSEPVVAAAASELSNYSLVSSGADREIGTADDVSIPLTPDYDTVSRTVTLVIDGGSTPLAGDIYRLRVLPTITDAAGNGLGYGAGQTYDFRVIHSGPYLYYANPDATLSTPGWSRLFVEFDRTIDNGTFTADDVTITNSFGDPVVNPGDMFISGAGSSFIVSFPLITIPDRYFISIGPDIRDLAGLLMNRDGDPFAGENPDDVFFTSVLITPALADQGGFLYDINPYDGTINSGGQIDPVTGQQINYTSYYGMYFLQVGGNDYSSSSGFVSTSADGRTVSLSTVVVNGLDVQRDIYVPTDDQFVRYVDSFTNTGGAPLTHRVRYFGYAGSYPSTQVTATGNGDLNFAPDDNFVATDDSLDDGGSLALAHVVMDGAGQVSLVETEIDSDFVGWSFDVTVNPGQTVRMMNFGVQQTTRASAQAQAATLVGLPETALAGLSEEVRASIVNFDVPPPPPPAVLSLDSSLVARNGTTAKPLNLEVASPLLDEALARWALAGADPTALHRLRNLPLLIGNLAGSTLAIAGASAIWLDRDAAGQSWYVDPTPSDDVEFALAVGFDAQRIDLLTVLMHELGHELGYAHSEIVADIMYAELSPGVRKSPTPVDAALLEVLADTGRTLDQHSLQLAPPVGSPVILNQQPASISRPLETLDPASSRSLPSAPAERQRNWIDRVDAFFTMLDRPSVNHYSTTRNRRSPGVGEATNESLDLDLLGDQDVL